VVESPPRSVSNLLATGFAMASARHSVSMSWFVSPVFTCW
jgi:hypothetical protein